MAVHRWILVLLATCAANVSVAQEQAADSADRKLAMQLAMQLKSELTKALQVSPQSAIEVCNERAPQIAGAIGAANDVKIGRTSVRVRNPANQPRAWQRVVLEDFGKRAAAGEPLANIEYSAVVRENGIAERRYMKAIATEPLCIACHGQQLEPALERAIAAKYPTDAATGFSVGELRGAVYVVRRVYDGPIK